MNEEDFFIKLTNTRYYKEPAKTGSTVFNYHGVKLNHQSLVKDGCDYLLYGTLILMVLPSKTPRTRLYELLEPRWEQVKRFIDWSEENGKD